MFACTFSICCLTACGYRGFQSDGAWFLKIGVDTRDLRPILYSRADERGRRFSFWTRNLNVGDFLRALFRVLVNLAWENVLLDVWVRTVPESLKSALKQSS